MDAIIFAEGNGFGHAARDRILCERFDIPIITYGDGARYCREKGMDFSEIPSPYVIESRKDAVKIISRPKDLLAYLRPQATEALKERFRRADLVIVDGSPLGIALAMLMRKRSIFITNDTAALVGVQGMLQRRIAGSLLTSLLRYPEALVVPDFPPPLTATMLNLNTSLPMLFTGPLARSGRQRRHGRRYLVAGQLEKLVRPILGDEAIYGSDVKDFSSCYRDAELVLTHAGHSTIMEALSLGKPLLCISERRYQERYNNALMLQRNDVGILLEEGLVSPQSLRLSIEYSGTLDSKRLALYRKAAAGMDPLRIFEGLLQE